MLLKTYPGDLSSSLSVTDVATDDCPLIPTLPSEPSWPPLDGIMTKLGPFDWTLSYGTIDADWNGDYLAVAYPATPFVLFFRRDGDDLIRLDDAALVSQQCYSVAWNGDYLAAGLGNDQIALLKRVGNTLTYVSITAVEDSFSHPRALSWNGDYLAVATFDEKHLYLYKLIDDELVYQNYPVDYPSHECKGLDWNGDYLAVATNTSPYVILYKLSSGVLVRSTDVSSDIAAITYQVKWNDDFLVATHGKYTIDRNLTSFNLVGNVLVQTVNPVTPVDNGLTIDWYEDYLLSGHGYYIGVGANLALYSKSGNILTRGYDPPDINLYPNKVSWGIGGYAVICVQAEPFLELMKIS